MQRTLNKISTILMIVVSIGLLVWLVFFTSPSGAQTKVVVLQFDRHRAAADVFKRRYNDYENMCGDLALPAAVQCQSSKDRYRMSQPLTEGGFYCIDSQGFVGVVERSPSGLRCQ